MNKKKNYRIKELDALRGIAALFVVLFHFTHNYRLTFGYDFSEKFDFIYGHYGVQLFFVISGFVIFMSLHNVKSVGDFLFKRFLRLYPTYWLCLILTIIIVSTNNIPGFQFTVKEKIMNFSMFQGLFNIKNIDGSYWSLLPELLFYLLMAMIYRFKLMSRIIYVSVIWLLLIIASTFKHSLLDIFLNLRFGMFFLAGIQFYRIRFEKDSLYEHLIIFGCLLSIYIVRKDLEYFLFSILIFGFFYLFIYNKLSFLNTKLFLFLGFISYPLYLLHQNIGYIIIYLLQQKGVNEYLSILIAIAISILFAWIISKYFEKKIIKKIKISISLIFKN
ncbi:acyltransferase [Flavivirga abyssicola]|uniref:acyltransferase family protein n=1 Tax=Flavivirga abyssicola TaxID=3063533 RepID=UPI0026DF0CA8|nr:acyltransferase [Flavivirga sp. MEBiC07777]WVK12982.1 acyltransferase [Flavivirga sp. MEBiC07777]